MHKFFLKKTLPNYVVFLLIFISVLSSMGGLSFLLNSHQKSNIEKRADDMKLSNFPVVASPIPQFSNGSLAQCGDYDDQKIGLQDRNAFATNPEWSQDCRFIVWSANRVGRGYYSEDPEEIKKIERDIALAKAEEGLYLYSDRLGNREKLKFSEHVEDPRFEGWYDRTKILIQYNNKKLSPRSERVSATYDIYSKELNTIEPSK
jgi:hypothetical protein